MTPSMKNRLGDETSPYLRQHKDNPVHWYAWGDEALAAARREKKPILLSIGYAACHWCHVMAHESFEDPVTADVMNDLFINIKLDREERPDLDAIYQQALGLLGQQGGWPLTMFLTPSGKPFWGGTYFPPESRWGRPAFRDILQKIAELHQNEPGKIENNHRQLLDAMERLATPKAGDAITPARLGQIADQFLSTIDRENGGVGRAPKFPHFSILDFLWRAYLRRGDTSLRDAVVFSLRQICQGGIYDHVGGGMARYTVDASWLVPHFEKMLYDNAALLAILTAIAPITDDPLFREKAHEVVGFLLRDMKAESVKDKAAFAASWDADSDGQEGKFYVWRAEEIASVLAQDAPLFSRHYDVTEGGNWEGATIVNRLSSPQWLGRETENRLAAARQELWEYREQRIKPGFDDKVLADWNGMTIQALARAALVFDQPRWLSRAEGAWGFIRDSLFDGDVFYHSWRSGQKRGLAYLDDYANMIAAGIALYETTGMAAYLEQAKDMQKTADRHFWDAEGGYFMTSDQANDIILRQKHARDQATPSGNGIMLENLARLWLLTGQIAYHDRAVLIEKAFAGEAEVNLFDLASYLNGVGLLHDPWLVVLTGMDTKADDLLRALCRHYNPSLVFQRVNALGILPPEHSAFGKTTGNSAIYLCSGRVCSLPITDTEKLEEQLRARYSWDREGR